MKKVTNKELLAELTKSHERNQMTDRLGELILTLAENYLNRNNWRNYTYKDEFLGLILLNISTYWRSFDMTKLNPFAYFTTIASTSCLQYLAYEKKHSKIKDESIKQANVDLNTGYHLDSPDVRYNSDGERV